MLVYLDSSVLIKKYFQEIGSGYIDQIWDESDYIAISQVGYSEILGTIHKKQKMERFSDRVKNQINKAFLEDWDSLIKVNVDTTLNSELIRIHTKYLLRGFDAIHLATGIILSKQFEKDLQFLTADTNLQNSAEKEKLDIGKYVWK
ncbi:MAG TPA: type II toxin-antitoxin system VapC family toxin [Leptospiraceae bacterium]|nr:type II toxin-antitoxin system VapC family toxin [Leptospiraceae bacterium]HMW08021.1 type II toxin-antitoxin system VapC family toxin [Leptospiraceae bacterium]HMX34704.1 type II toxin-antitoxin system VapC family toxin [Leptospiraceae bacterium]HMY33759.1 type II toxin-antitoxin system VapC family toxin [Leptospiraceae bacterium]HMZ64869.1 type II toxin-antitoxin system VapC family toxin [Leptospiraceae bacterium]